MSFEFNNYIEDSVDNLEELNHIINDTGFLLMHVNIRSLNANYEKLELLIASLITKPHVIVCSETWNLPYQNMFSLENYTCYYNNSHINKADGVIIYISNDLEHSTTTEVAGQCKILTTCVKINPTRVLKISGIYRCHDYDKREFLNDLETYIKNNQKNNNHILIGDFNIDINDVDELSELFLANLLDMNFLPMFNNITRPSGDFGSCIDNMFVKTKIECESITLKQVFTDHYPIFLAMKIKNKQRTKDADTTFSYNKLANICSRIDWTSLLSIEDLNVATDQLVIKIQNILSASRVKSKKRKFKPRKAWITPGLIKSCCTKEKMYSDWKKNKNNLYLKTKYLNYCKKLDKLLKITKLKYETEEARRKSKNSKDLWQFINKKLGKESVRDNQIDYVIKDDVKISNANELADIFVDFFSNVGPNLAARIPGNVGGADEGINQNSNSIFLYPTDQHEIETIVSKLKNKAGGVDGISTKVLKIISPYISSVLTYIFNKSMTSGKWPKALKCAEIIPIFKSGNKHSMTNYRPISLISNLAKIFEKIIHARLFKFVMECDIISSDQYGFMKNKGTKDALASISNHIYTNIDANNPTVITFLDLAKAFDTVNHNILLNKLYKYGIRGIAYDLIKNYLTDRLQVVKINKIISKKCVVKLGVPQGTVLGPLLFILYVNDMFKILPNKCLAAFADDTVIKCVGKTWSEVQKNMSGYLDRIGIWLQRNYLTLNIEKTTYITYGSYSDSVPEVFQLKIYNKTIKRVNNCKYLGLYFDCHMKWDVHIGNLIKKVRFLLFIFYKLKKYMCKKSLKIIYHALFESIVNYGIIAWGGCNKTTKSILVRIQNKLINIFSSDNSVLGVRESYILEALCYHYANCKNAYESHQGITRHKSLIIPKVNKEIAFKNSTIVAIKYFNKLPTHLKTLRLNNKTIRKKLKNWLVTTLQI